MGLRIQLGHSMADFCPHRQLGHSKFVVIAINGIHSVNVDFCGCPGHPEHYVQLLEMCYVLLLPILAYPRHQLFRSWLYTQIIAGDANFKQKARLRSSVARDPPLAPGCGTFINNEGYQAHLLDYVDQDEVSALWLNHDIRPHSFHLDKSLCGICCLMECEHKACKGLESFGHQIGDLCAA
jgi:hypothetical protein